MDDHYTVKVNVDVPKCRTAKLVGRVWPWLGIKLIQRARLTVYMNGKVHSKPRIREVLTSQQVHLALTRG